MTGAEMPLAFISIQSASNPVMLLPRFEYLNGTHKV
jgi:hypothetical protein